MLIDWDLERPTPAAEAEDGFLNGKRKRTDLDERDEIEPRCELRLLLGISGDEGWFLIFLGEQPMKRS